MMHMWGRINPSKDSNMYPQPEYGVQGWDITRMACGNGKKAAFGRQLRTPPKQEKKKKKKKYTGLVVSSSS
jgi:hypothetical protein